MCLFPPWTKNNITTSLQFSKVIEAIRDNLVFHCLCDQPATLSDRFSGSHRFGK